MPPASPQNPSDAAPTIPGVDDGDTTTFADLGLHPSLLTVLDALGYEEPTPIQRETIPHLLEHRDLLGQAATGTGKTAAFALPLLHHLAASKPGKAPRALILVPTRELAMQVSEATHNYGRTLGSRVLPVYGGQPIWRQVKALERGVDVVVGTPGRVLDHITRKTLHLGRLEIVVLDEADEMLDMGFAEDLEAILAETPEVHQTVLFSATMPPRIDNLVKHHVNEPIRISLTRAEATAGGQGPQITQTAYVVPRPHKPAALGRILDLESPESAIVFCKTRNDVDQLTDTMNARGYRAEALHGGLNQQQRDKVMERLRSQTADLLVATDVAARGLDIDHLTHVVNYDVPSAPEAYVHRIGRVGRAGREGVAITLVEPRQHRLLKNIERHTGQKMLMESLPTAEDLHAHRLEATTTSLREVLEGGELEKYRHVVERLAEEADLMEVAMAAIKLAHEGEAGSEAEPELPEITLPKGPSGSDRPDRGPKGGPNQRPRQSKHRGSAPSPGAARLWVSLGKNAGVLPKDLVGAIANETSVPGRDIGNIDITPNFSLVEVPDAKADEVIRALQRTTIRGKKAKIRRDRTGPKG